MFRGDIVPSMSYLLKYIALNMFLREKLTEIDTDIMVKDNNRIAGINMLPSFSLNFQGAYTRNTIVVVVWIPRKAVNKTIRLK